MTNQPINDRVVERIYVKGIFELTSPCVIGSGENDRTDVDFVRDWCGCPYIPGTSLAGVLRNFFACNGKEDKIIQLMFGRRKGSDADTTQSRLYVSDAYLYGKLTGQDMAIRDGVGLDYDTKTAKEHQKYDYEVVEPQTKFVLKMELVLRETDPVEQLENVLFMMLNAMTKQQIYVGAKKRRGFGRGKLHSLEILRLDFRDEQKRKDYVEQWLNFNWDSFKGNVELNHLNHPSAILSNFLSAKKIYRIKVPLVIVHSLMIRNYRSLSLNKNDHDVDYVHLRSRDNPVIPGTSWAGAFRHRMFHILVCLFRSRELEPDVCCTYAQNILNDLFGYTDEKNKKARASRIWFYESVVHDGMMLEQSRIKIDRFTGGVVDGALFQEIPVYKGTTLLEIVVESRSDEEAKADMGLLILALKDLMAGYLAVGGETNTGKGILSGNRILIQIHEEEFELNDELQQQYLQALSSRIHQMADGLLSTQNGR